MEAMIEDWTIIRSTLPIELRVIQNSKMVHAISMNGSKDKFNTGSYSTKFYTPC